MSHANAVSCISDLRIIWMLWPNTAGPKDVCLGDCLVSPSLQFRCTWSCQKTAVVCCTGSCMEEVFWADTCTKCFHVVLVAFLVSCLYESTKITSSEGLNVQSVPFSVAKLRCGFGYLQLPVISNYDSFCSSDFCISPSILALQVQLCFFDATELQRSGENTFNIFDGKMQYIIQFIWCSDSGLLQALNQKI